MTAEGFAHVSGTVESLITVLSILVAGGFVYWKYVLAQERFPNVEFRCEIRLIGKQGGYWIAELIAVISNAGKVQHRINELDLELNAILLTDPVETSENWGGQVDFPHSIAKASFMRERSSMYFVDANTSAKYSYIAHVPETATFLLLHCGFQYLDNRKFGHTAEASIYVPQVTTPAQPSDLMS